MKVLDASAGDAEWRERTLERCRYDMHHFHTRPYGVPVAWDERRQRVRMLGYWCSLECALAWLLYTDMPEHVRKRRVAWLQRQARVLYGYKAAVRPAPSPAAFARMATIEEFRALCRPDHECKPHVQVAERFERYEHYIAARPSKSDVSERQRQAAVARQRAETQRQRHLLRKRRRTRTAKEVQGDFTQTSATSRRLMAPGDLDGETCLNVRDMLGA